MVRFDIHHSRPRGLLARVLCPGPVLLMLAVLWGIFLVVLHPWLMTWGASPEEQHLALPGDEYAPTAYFTRAITIHAPTAAVWPWLLQIGQDRAGFYSNDWLENLALADIHNADVLRPEWQHRALGDRVPMAGAVGWRLVGEASRLTVRLLEPERAIADVPGRFVLLPIDDHTTRLLLREPLAGPERQGPFVLIWDPMHFVMEQRLLRGIKERAEGQPLTPPVVMGVARAGWALAGLGLLGLFLARRWRVWALLPIGLMAPVAFTTGDLNASLAGFLAIGITLAGALAWGRRWWPPYLLLASGVALTLLLAPDAYVAFGLAFASLGAAFLATTLRRRAAPRHDQAAPTRPIAATR